MAAGKPAAGSTDLPSVADYHSVPNDLGLAAAACLDTDWPKHSQVLLACQRCPVHAPCSHVAVEAMLGLHAHLAAPVVEAIRQWLLLPGGSAAGSRAPSGRTCPVPATQSTMGRAGIQPDFIWAGCGWTYTQMDSN